MTSPVRGSPQYEGEHSAITLCNLTRRHRSILIATTADGRGADLAVPVTFDYHLKETLTVRLDHDVA